MPVRPSLAWPLLALFAFAALLGLVGGDWAPLYGADGAMSDAFRAYGQDAPEAVAVARTVTDVMGTLAFLTVGLAATALLAARGQRRAAGFCAAVTAAIPLLWGVLHTVLHRPRPVDGFVTIESNGFPSGHTANATAAAITGVLLVWPALSRRGRIAAMAVAAAFAAVIGLTRVALLAHWPSDVLGGWLLALVVVPLLAVAFAPPRAATSRDRPRPSQRQ